MTEYAPIIEVNCETGERIIRQPNEEEIAQMQKDAIEYQRLMDEQIAKNNAKEEARASAIAKLAALGLTADEIAAL